MHYAAIESNRELDKSFKVIALLLLIFGPNMIIIFFAGVKPQIFSRENIFMNMAFFNKKPEGLDC